MADSLLDEFSASAAQSQRTFTSTERFALLVKEYINVQGQGNLARVAGQRWETGEEVEVYLRPSEVNERKEISEFYSDQGSMPVTTPIGGVIMIENAYVDNKATPTQAGKPVYSASWMIRASEAVAKGYPCTNAETFMRVNTPKPKNFHNPAEGFKQNITLLLHDKTQTASSLGELDKKVLDQLDPAIHRADKENYRRPGAIGCGVRIIDTATGENNLKEIYGGFYLPTSEQYSQPKPREMVLADLKENQSWNMCRSTIEKAFADDTGRYKVQVVPMSSVGVGRATVQTSVKNSTKRIMPSTVDVTDRDGNTKSVNGFTKGVVGVIVGNHNHLNAIYAKPTVTNPLVSLTGMPTASEQESHRQQIKALTEKYIGNSAPKANKAATPVPAPAQNEMKDDAVKRMVLVKPAAGNMIDAHFNSSEQALQAAHAVGGIVKDSSCLIERAKLPQFHSFLENNKFQIDVIGAHSQDSTKTNTQGNPTPEVEPAKVENPKQEVDLSSLDFDNVDFDKALSQGYEEQEASHKIKR